jgi:hypothetical protein
MRRINTYTCSLLLVFLSGCASGPAPVPDLVYRSIPEALLEECVLPEAPENTDQLSDAFVVAYKCAQLGNKDKQRIRLLIAE